MTEESKKFWALVHPGGPRGIVLEEPKLRPQDDQAAPLEGYMVIFFPKITGIGDARIFHSMVETFSSTSEAAIVKFMDGIAAGERWETYEDAGHCVRRVIIADSGPAARVAVT